MTDSHDSTAGRGDPYWYEWFVGTMEVIHFLEPDTDVQSVTFQKSGVKGWDDVVVRIKGGKRRCYQVKHTREGDTLTFGNLVGGADSLLSQLFTSWKSSGLDDGLTRCILYTNRRGGTNSATARSTQVFRPPLMEFMEWLNKSLPNASKLADLKPKQEWSDAWAEWRRQLDVDDNETFKFLHAFDILTNQDDTEKIVECVRNQLSKAFGVPVERVEPMVDALHRALRKWTTADVEVTAELFYSELALKAEVKDLALAPPPPEPFFPTRTPVAAELERELTQPTQESVFFLTAEPGAGKTSLLSWLAIRRENEPLTGIIGLRFFCFEPIRPESPFIEQDSSRVRPNDLWFSLLSQLREGLRGRLKELLVPLRNDLLDWKGARTHVLRLSSHLGKELGRPFVIVIDGIDHAARAAQTNPQQSHDFFASLPSPDELSGKSIRILIAGQPPENYSSHYPNWLVTPHSEVRKIELSNIQDDDIRSLIQSSNCKIPADQFDAVIRLIQQRTQGNTLATVFAVAETEKAVTIEELDARLTEMRLCDGLATYYSSIWSFALRSLKDDCKDDIDASLVTAISLARRWVTRHFLSSVFHEWNKPTDWWESRLEELGPMLTSGPHGYRVRHNDVRVFLAGRFAALSTRRRTRIVNRLSEHFKLSDSDRLDAHLQLLELLKLEERPDDFSRVFDVDWVIEAGSLKIETSQLLTECETAIKGLPQLKEWPLVVNVACAAQTLDRLVEAREQSDYATECSGDLPTFLPSEARICPLSQWTLDDLRSLVRDAEMLLESNEQGRARSLLRRWIDELSFAQLLERIQQYIVDEHHQVPGKDPRISQTAITMFNKLGRLTGRLGLSLLAGESEIPLFRQSLFKYESEFILGKLEQESHSLDYTFNDFEPRILCSWIPALRNMARQKRWRIVKDVLGKIRPIRPSLPGWLQAEITEWALRSGADEDEPAWLSPISETAFGIDKSRINSNDPRDEIAPYLSIAFALGWTRIGMSGRDIAACVNRQFDPNQRHVEWKHAALTMFRAAALLGRAESAIKRNGEETARQLIPTKDVKEILGVLWGPTVTRNIRFFHRDSASELAASIVELAGKLGGEYESIALEIARPFAADYPVDLRMPVLWSILWRNGERKLLHQWMLNWIGDDGKAWKESQNELHSIVSEFLPRAQDLGEYNLAEKAAERLRWRLIGYWERKDTGFWHIWDWYRALSRMEPSTWRIEGSKVRHLCELCSERSGDNRLKWDLLTSVSAAAIDCGPGDWLALLEDSLAEGFSDDWYSRTSGEFIEGVIQAVDAGHKIHSGDHAILWSLGLAFSLWYDDDQNKSLLKFRRALEKHAGNPSDSQTLPDCILKSSRSQSLDLILPDKNEIPDAQTNETIDSSQATSLDFNSIKTGIHILPSVAAANITSLVNSSASESNQLVEEILTKIGVEYGGNWNYGDKDVLASLRTIVRNVRDNQLWLIAESIANGMDSDKWHRVIGVYPNLFMLAQARAESYGSESLKPGLETQIQMHIQWSGKRDFRNYEWPLSPTVQQDMTWRSVAIKVLMLLLDSRCSEILTAALEGLHMLVEAEPDTIEELFAACTTDWQRHWLLSASESWAVLHADSLSAVTPLLQRYLSEGSLTEKLQSWVVLQNLSESLRHDLPEFPIPNNENSKTQGYPLAQGGILYAPGIPRGKFVQANAYSSANRLIETLKVMGLDFEHLTPEIGARLGAMNAANPGKVITGPRLNNSVICNELSAQTAVGDVFLRNMSGIDQANIPVLAQGFLDNDEALLQRTPPRRASESTLWLGSREYYAKEPRDQDVLGSLRSIAQSLDITEGWQTFTARVFDSSLDRDYVLHLWYEECITDNDGILQLGEFPSCPSGRSFIWRKARFFEPRTKGRFVSGYFVGGMQRLGHDIFHIQPPRAWRDRLGWTIKRNDPLIWLDAGRPVARYERLHGPLMHSDKWQSMRQPVIDRWVISDQAFDMVQSHFNHCVFVRSLIS